mgnify:CR=1 FL=1
MLFVFGDSFSHDFSDFESSNNIRKSENLFPTYQPIEHNWVNLVAKKLTGTTKQVNDSMAGCANEFIFHRFMSRIDEIQDGDYVIVSFTSQSRRWLVERSPHLSNWANSKIDPVAGGITKSEYNAMQQYAKYLHSDMAANAIYNSVFWATVRAAETLQHRNVKVLLLPGFDPIAGVSGTLTDASFAEFDNTNTRSKFYKKTNDSRWNHFSDENHKILADKVCTFFKDYTPVDLTTGFKNSIYNTHNI